MIRNSGLTAVAGCLWLVSALLLLPGIWIGLSYGYSFSEWLSLIPFPAERKEIAAWLLRVTSLLIFVGSTLWLAISALRKTSRAGRP